MTTHPARLILADHFIVRRTAGAATAPAVCACGWRGAACDHPEHQTEMLEAAGLLVTVDQAPTWTPGAGFGSCYCQLQPRHFRGPGCEMVVEL